MLTAHCALMTQLNPDATYRHKRIATELRKLREERGYTVQKAADLLGWSRPKLQKYEYASRKPSVSDVERLIDFYTCDEALGLALVKYTKLISQRGVLADFLDVLDPSFIELEQEALEIRAYQGDVIPGLLQDDDYAYALINLASSQDENRQLKGRRLAARAARQERLLAEDAPIFHAVIEEAVLRRPVGGPEVMQRQLQALLQSAKLPNVQIQVMPTDRWQHAGYAGSFMIMGFGGSGNFDVVYVEGAVGSSAYLEKAAQLERSRLNFAGISKAALTELESAALIEDLLAQ